VTVEGDGEGVAASAYLYLYDGGDDVGQEWTSWLPSVLPGLPTPAPAT
jgi:hypothetical protein